MRKMELRGANFEGATLVFADFTGMNLTGVSFKDANLTGAKFAGADLTGADLRGAVVDRVNFTKAVMDRVIASGMKYSGLSRLNIAGAKSFRDADLRNSDLRGSFAGGDFRGTNFSGARLVDIVWPNDRSNLRGARYDSLTRWPASFDPVAAGAILGPTDASPASKPTAPAAPKVDPVNASGPPVKTGMAAGEDLQGKSLVGVDLRMRNLRRGNLQDADLTRANLIDTDLQGADFRHANLTSALLDKADLTGADLRGANLLRARLIDAKLIDANLEGQKLYLAGAEANAERPAGVSTFGLEGTIQQSNGALTLRGANLRNARIFGSLAGVDLRKADLRGTDFTGARDLDKTRLTGARYDARTRWAFDPTGSGAELIADSVPSVAAPLEVVPLYWLLGRWNLVPTDTEVDPGVLNINGNRTYTWTMPKDESVAKGSWRAATDVEVRDVGGTCLILQKAGLDLDWRVAKYRSVLGGDDEIQLTSGTSVRTAVRRNSLPPAATK